MKRVLGLISFLLAIQFLSGCDTGTTSVEKSDEMTVNDAELAGNPFRQDWETPYGVPPFSDIENSDYLPAIKKAILEMRDESQAIVSNSEEPTFANTIVALELAGESLNKVSRTFGNITGTDTDEELRSLETEIYPMLTREYDSISLNEVLYDRVKKVYDSRESLGLNEQDSRR